jgi:hypothetical protein
MAEKLDRRGGVESMPSVGRDLTLPPPSPGQSLNLADRQMALLEVFGRKSEALGRMYVGALQAWRDRANPDRLALAAHGFREVMMKLPEYFAVPMPSVDARLGDKVDVLRQHWNKLPKTRLPGEPLPPKLISRLESFFVWLEDSRPRFKERAAGIVRGLDPAGRALPPPIEAIRVDEWNMFRTFFVRAAHHEQQCPDAEFDLWIEQFETFILNLAKPRTFENADLLDALIQEGEGGG